MRSMKKVFTENSVLQIDQGNLIICLKTPVLSKLTMDQGNLMRRNSSSAHTVKEQFAPEENRDIALFITDKRVQSCNQRGGHRLQHSKITTFCSETITWRQRSRFDSEDREPPSSTCTSKRSSTTSTIQSLQQRIKRHDEVKLGTSSLCELLDVEPKAQCKICLSYWDVGIVYCTCGHFLQDGTEENKKFVKYTLHLPLDSQLLHQERATPRAPQREEAGGSRVLHREFAQEEMQEEKFLGYSRPGSSVMRSSART